MQLCPKCGSDNIHRSRARAKWEEWRQRVTGKRPYRCRKCNWRGWGVDLGVLRAADGGLVPEPPNLRPMGLARDDRRTALDLEALDTFEAPVDERT